MPLSYEKSSPLNRLFTLAAVGSVALVSAGAKPARAETTTLAQEPPSIIDFTCDYAPTDPQFFDPNCPGYVPLFEIRGGRYYDNIKHRLTNFPID